MSALPFIVVPKKRTSKKARPPVEVRGLVESVTFHNPNNGFSVLQVSTEEYWKYETVVGFTPSVCAGIRLRATGRWQQCDGGRQLRADVIRTELPTDLDEVEECLGSGLVEGIGTAYAKRFMEAFGGKVFNVIDKNPKKLLAVEGVGQKRCDLIASTTFVK